LSDVHVCTYGQTLPQMNRPTWLDGWRFGSGSIGVSVEHIAAAPGIREDHICIIRNKRKEYITCIVRKLL